MSVFQTLALLCSFGGSLAAFISTSSNFSCPDVKTLPSFDAEKYAGTWYGVRIYPGPKSLISCLRANNTLYDEQWLLSKSSLTILWTQIKIKKSSIFNQPDASQPGKLKLKPLSGSLPDEDYWILGTDYTSYAVVYKCRKINDRMRLATATILARVPQVEDSEIEKAFQVAETNHLDRKKFVLMDQINCSED